MESCKPEQIFTRIPGFEEGSKTLAQSIHSKILDREGTRKAADILHGTWMEHPLHPALTDFVIGAWICGSILDGVTLTHRSKGIERAADILISLGNAAALPTALAGLADFSTIRQRSLGTAATHAVLNAGGLAMNIASSFCRSFGLRRAGIGLSAAASGTLLFSAWLGGKLAFQQRVGVNKIPEQKIKEEWTTALKESELQEKVPVRVDVEETAILVYRSAGETHAICAVCAHEGGPLDEGQFDGHLVTCPWHQSVFDLRDGRVIHGPSTYPEPTYETRSLEGIVEIKARQALTK